MTVAAEPPVQKSVAQKLQVKQGDTVRISGDAGEERRLVGALPDGAAETDESGTPSVAVTFVHDRGELLARFAADLPSLGGARAVWYLYEKGGRSEVNRDTIMREAGAFGWRAISNVAVDDTWSAARVRPLADGEAPVG
ncbi:hypothetical protein [Leifsonia sp. Root227]|uniref:hypothetical protein n=1 Tax=Leifsonia sp. Root227 TaxID=1736496 RepID=UPI000AD37822|nr:hypothetical protein [Leifsonia sp. Root227]